MELHRYDQGADVGFSRGGGGGGVVDFQFFFEFC